MYADWLQENGQPERAEFIRVQIELAKPLEFDSERVTAVHRANQLLTQHVEEWTKPFSWVFAGLQPVAWDDHPSSPARVWETVVGVTGLEPGKSFPE
jgi:hypothetical protein